MIAAMKTAWKLVAALSFALLGVPARTAGFEDTLAQRLKACTACHGDQGRAGPDGYYPRLAGKPAGYLFNQLVNFRDGRRHYGLMTGMVDRLSDAYLLEIAQHFAALDLPYPAPSSPPLAEAQRARGATLALQGDAQARLPACMACHGRTLTGVAPHVPGLLGLPRDYLNAQLGAWKTGQRRAHAPDCMAQVVQRLGPQDIAAITGWLAAQPVPKPSHPAATLPAPMPLDCGSAPAAASGASR
ncbi:MAG: c-type cytochrome [Burkholderiales bacterium]|nr:c-type cytochrome [Burkholderiales bacterium]